MCEYNYDQIVFSCFITFNFSTFVTVSVNHKLMTKSHAKQSGRPKKRVSLSGGGG